MIGIQTCVILPRYNRKFCVYTVKCMNLRITISTVYSYNGELENSHRNEQTIDVWLFAESALGYIMMGIEREAIQNIFQKVLNQIKKCICAN